MRVRVKLCGLTRRQDAEDAVALGVDALGFILAPSKRRVSLEQAAELAAGLPPFVARVGVVVDPEADELRRIADSGVFDWLQFCGDEAPELLARVPVRRIKAVGIAAPKDVDKASRYDTAADALLFDTKKDGRTGGTGTAFDWSCLLRRTSLRPFILAGGLSPENLADALARVAPFAVDLNSGVEHEPGVKDRAKLRTCMEIVRWAQTWSGE